MSRTQSGGTERCPCKSSQHVNPGSQSQAKAQAKGGDEDTSYDKAAANSSLVPCGCATLLTARSNTIMSTGSTMRDQRAHLSQRSRCDGILRPAMYYTHVGGGAQRKHEQGIEEAGARTSHTARHRAQDTLGGGDDTARHEAASSRGLYLSTIHSHGNRGTCGGDRQKRTTRETPCEAYDATRR